MQLARVLKTAGGYDNYGNDRNALHDKASSESRIRTIVAEPLMCKQKVPQIESVLVK